MKYKIICPGAKKNIYRFEKSASIYIFVGDAGNPLVCQRCNSCDWYLVGTAGFQTVCGMPRRSFSVFTQTTFFEQWITTTTGLAFSQQTCVRPSKL